MSRKISVIAGLVAMGVVAGVCAEEAAEEQNVIIDGVEDGKFTQDYDAAMAYAKEHKLPIFVNFTGSDWCGWCKIMDKNVFSKEDWTAYAKDNLVLIWLDFPRDKSKVPEKYRERNDELSDMYGVRGYPTYIVMDWDGSKVGQLGSGRDKTPDSFKAEIEKVLRNTKSSILKRSEAYKPADAAKVKAAMDALGVAQSELDGVNEKVRAMRKEADELEGAAEEKAEEAQEALSEALEMGMLNVMTDERRAEYEAAKEAAEAAEEALEEWSMTNRRKKPTAELREERASLIKAYEEAQDKVDSF